MGLCAKFFFVRVIWVRSLFILSFIYSFIQSICLPNYTSIYSSSHLLIYPSIHLFVKVCLKLPSVVTIFLARAVLILTNPSHYMYNSIRYINGLHIHLFMCKYSKVMLSNLSHYMYNSIWFINGLRIHLFMYKYSKFILSNPSNYMYNSIRYIDNIIYLNLAIHLTTCTTVFST